jgi:MerC mercury resistance protein
MAKLWSKWQWDGLGLSIAGLCLMHCLASSVLLVFLASAGGLLLDPIIHEIGLLLAIVFGMLALGKGLWDHGFIMPTAIGAVGIGMMATALTIPHGTTEIVLTVIGVAILAWGHVLNHRASN